jgi:hypothetical protein
MNTGRISKQILSATRTKISHMYSGEREKENKETNRPPGIILDRKKKFTFVTSQNDNEIFKMSCRTSMI